MRTPSAAGFTLIEILVSLLILAVMGAVVAPALLQEREPPDMVDAEGRLDALFRMARDSAVRTGTPVTVVLDSVSGLVWLDTHARLGEAAPPPAPESLDLPASIALELFQARSRFTFMPNGAVTGDSLRLRGPLGQERLLTLDPWTARVRAR